MKRWQTVLLVSILIVAVYWLFLKPSKNRDKDPKMEPIVLKKHSTRFNHSVDNMINAYLFMKDAFVARDTAQIKANARLFISSIDSIHTEELNGDDDAVKASLVANLMDIRSNAESLISQTNLQEMRQDFRMVTEMMYPAFFKTVNYQGRKLYLFYCPMAFGEDKGASWIDDQQEVKNPFLGKGDQSINDGMVPCGEIKDTIKAF